MEKEEPELNTVIRTFANEVEAHVAQAVLDANGIDSNLIRDDAGGMMPWLQWLHPIRLVVREEDSKDAVELLDTPPRPDALVLTGSSAHPPHLAYAPCSQNPALTAAPVAVSGAAPLRVRDRFDSSSNGPVPTASDLARAKRILSQTPLIDGHNDLPWRIREDSVRRAERRCLRPTQAHAGSHGSRSPEARDGRRAVLVGLHRPASIVTRDTRGFSSSRSTSPAADRQVSRPARAGAQRRRHPRDFKQGKIGSLLGLEGGHAIENSLGALRAYYDLGVRYMTLTHNVTLDWADAALDSAKHGGLTPFGDERRARDEPARHAGRSVARLAGNDERRAQRRPRRRSSSRTRARAPRRRPRNVPDSILARVTTNGGIVMVPFVTGFVSPAVLLYDQSTRPVMTDLQAKYGNDTRRDHARGRSSGARRIPSRARLCHRWPIRSSTCAKSRASITSESAATSTGSPKWCRGSRMCPRFPPVRRAGETRLVGRGPEEAGGRELPAGVRAGGSRGDETSARLN